MDRKGSPRRASYFGVEVEVVNRMDSYSLIRYHGQTFIVDSFDLVSCLRLRRTARSVGP